MALTYKPFLSIFLSFFFFRLWKVVVDLFFFDGLGVGLGQGFDLMVRNTAGLRLQKKGKWVARGILDPKLRRRSRPSSVFLLFGSLWGGKLLA